MSAGYVRRLRSTASHGLEARATELHDQHAAAPALARETMVEHALVRLVVAGDHELEFVGNHGSFEVRRVCFSTRVRGFRDRGVC